MQPALLAGAAFSAALAAIYLYVGFLLARRPLPEGARRGAALFAVWWVAIGVVAVTEGLRNLLAGLGAVDVHLHSAISQGRLVALALGVFALLAYVAYLFTGRTWLAVPLGLTYFLALGLLFYGMWAAQPTGVEINGWHATLEYAQRPPAASYLPALLLFNLPPIAATVAYLTLVRKSTNPTTRWRIAVVGSSILASFAASLLGSVLGQARSDAWEIGTRVLVLAAASALLLAYHPPAWARHRWGVRALHADA